MNKDRESNANDLRETERSTEGMGLNETEVTEKLTEDMGLNEHDSYVNNKNHELPIENSRRELELAEEKEKEINITLDKDENENSSFGNGVKSMAADEKEALEENNTLSATDIRAKAEENNGMRGDFESNLINNNEHPTYIENSDNQQELGSKSAKKKERRKFLKVGAIFAVVSLLFGFGGGVLAVNLFGDGTTLFQSIAQPVSSANQGGTTTEQVAAVSADTVVEIKTEVAKYNPFNPSMVEEGAGSGVIISQDGYIVTNNHVIEGASKITVTTRDGEEYSGEIVGSDTESDLAVIKIQAEELSAAVMGNSEDVALGQQAVVIGNPLGELGGSVTEGIISSLDREISIEGQTMNLLQTDASINPGNSGGGLFNANGELIGIVVAKSSGSEVEGLGFAIPIDQVKSVTESIIEDGYVTGKAILGIGMIDIVSQESANQYGVSTPGVYIGEITEGSAAESAGLEIGDQLLSIDGNEIESAADVQAEISNREPGDSIEIKIIRDGEEATITAKLEESKA